MRTITILFLCCCSTLISFAQSPHLETDGHVKIRGNIDIHHMDDSTSLSMGWKAGVNTTFESRRENTFVGSYAGFQNTTGDYNSFFGRDAGKNNDTGDYNSFFGEKAGYTSNTGNCNSFFGQNAGGFNKGDDNSFFGQGAGYWNYTGTRNTFVGSRADQLYDGFFPPDSLDRAIAIGYRAKVNCSNCAVIGGTGADAVKVGIGTSSPTSALDVEGDANISGNIGIGTTTPATKLEVNGNVRSHGNTCRSGVSGTYGSNIHNIFWTGSKAQLWIDVTNLGDIQLTSDRRLKENIHPIEENALERIMALRPLKYQYKNIQNTIFQGDRNYYEGFIADEIQDIIPSAVSGIKDGLTSDGGIQPQTLNSVPILAVLTKAIQELVGQNQAMAEVIGKQQEMINKLKSEAHKNENIEAELAEIRALLDRQN